VIANGIAASGMPAFSRLSEATTWQLVAFVRTLGGVALDLRSADAAGTRYVWDLPPGFPRPKVPADNPMSTAKVELGRHLFYDTRLSVDGTFSCASCHEQRLAFTDGKARAVGVTGEVHPRSSMGLANIAYSPVLTWANPTVRRLEAQALVPMFGEDPVELGLSGLEAKMLARLEAEPRYGPLFAAAFPGDPTPVSLATVTRAIASFERSLLSGRTPYDRYRTGADPGGISASAKRGEDIFFSERTECFHCHGGFNFTETVDHVGKGFLEIEFHNTGLYNLDEDGAYPPRNTGVHEVSDDPEDMGRFKAPSLRNIALTAPYMHDGSIATLHEVVRHYEAGGRTVADGPYKGVGANNPRKSQFVKAFTLTDQERADLVAFLESLTDTAFVTDPRHADPWPPRARK
jgi:cytochrome c peroxidase